MVATSLGADRHGATQAGTSGRTSLVSEGRRGSSIDSFYSTVQIVLIDLRNEIAKNLSLKLTSQFKDKYIIKSVPSFQNLNLGYRKDYFILF